MGFHPTLPQLVTASSDRTVRRWDYEQGEQIGQPLLHPDAVQDAAFIDGGRFIATATKQGDVRLWDPATGEPVTPWVARSYNEYAEYSLGNDNTSAGEISTVDREWDTSPAPHTFEDLISLSNLLSWGTTPKNQPANRRTAGSFAAEWQRLKQAYPSNFERSTGEILNWRQRETLAYTNPYPGFRHEDNPSRWFAAAWHADRLLPELAKPARNWLLLRAGIKARIDKPDEAVADYTAALEMIPRDDAVLHERARLYLAREEFASAKEDLQRAFAIQFAEYEQAKSIYGDDDHYSVAELLDSSPVYYELAMVHLAAGDHAAYGKVCEQLLTMCGDVGDRELLEQVAWLCALSPTLGDVTRALKMAEESAELHEHDARSLRTFGAALYRSGKYDEASQKLEEALAKQSEFASAWLLLALTEQQRGNTEQAKAWLAKGAAWVDHERLSKQKPWTDRAFLDALLKEAQALIED
jgi:tetratricopeptide (TPR) repeat protein